MQITTLVGSARKKGNTATVLGWVEDELKFMGHDIDRIYLHGKSISGCLGCGKCREKPYEIGCVQKDDAIEIMKQMIKSDAVLYASPIYFWSYSAQMKALIDRCYSLVANYGAPDHTSLMVGKRLGLLVTGADAYEDNAEAMFTAFDRIVDYFIAVKAGELYVGNCSEPEHLPDGVKDKARVLARSLVG